MESSGIDHVNIRIPEDGVEEAVNFYQEVLGFRPMKLEEFQNDERTSFFFRISEDSVINIRPKEDFQRPSGKNFDHFCISLKEKIGDVKELMKENSIEILREGSPLGAKGRGPGVYIRDPFGYRIELKAEK
ncbi:VOC family protein [Candidatus Nanosalina sp. VS9-1]|uniref:VOC family protein n=1 Tax=Candidatus Nanosalina sp. VS9-1 TaxID=3388566 RepID=UPI0039DF7674